MTSPTPEPLPKRGEPDPGRLTAFRIRDDRPYPPAPVPFGFVAAVERARDALDAADRFEREHPIGDAA